MSQALFQYRVRLSRRARYARLRVTVRDGLEVVLPRGYDPSLVPRLLERHERWIRNALKRAEQQRPLSGHELVWSVPTSIVLAAAGRVWTVTTTETRAGSVIVRALDGAALSLSGAVESEAACRRALTRWLVSQATAHLVPRLDVLSAQTGLSYKRASVRRQRTRWGSCSRERAISLNAKLMFLAPELVDYVLIHELCHTVELNHSERFWSAVGRYCPRYKQLDRRLRDAWKVVPVWAD